MAGLFLEAAEQRGEAVEGLADRIEGLHLDEEPGVEAVAQGTGARRIADHRLKAAEPFGRVLAFARNLGRKAFCPRTAHSRPATASMQA